MARGRLLIANRGEVAARIAHSASDIGWETVAVHAPHDAVGRHLTLASEVVELPGQGVRAYLDIDAMVAAATASYCTAVHPGWGFLAESAAFAAACEAAGLVFVGPTPDQLRLFGDKLAARALAERCEVPILAASSALGSPADLDAFRATLPGDRELIIKAAAGGGGRGMHVLGAGNDVEQVLARCRDEARTAFGDDTVYAEQFLARARHLEVQIVGDGSGAVVHLGERDCSLQRRHQKIIELAPAPHLSAPARAALVSAAERMAGAVNYRNLGTFEFLLDTATEAFYFIEANPRLQVEHTVTEAVHGVDLVATALELAEGRTLAELDLSESTTGAPRAVAVQLRVNAERVFVDTGSEAHPRAGAEVGVEASTGTLAVFELPRGPGIRVDTALGVGDPVSPAYDSLIAKLVVHANAPDHGAALRRAARAASEFQIAGVSTNLSLLRALLEDEDVCAGRTHTRWVDEHIAELLARTGEIEAENDANRAAPASAEPAAPIPLAGPAGSVAVPAPMPGSVVEMTVEPGQSVQRGASVAVLESMKMHHVIVAPMAGEVVATPVSVGQALAQGEPLAFVVPGAVQADDAGDTSEVDLDAPRADLDEVRARHAYGLDANRPEAVARRRRLNARTARENVADLCDPDSFIEYGALAIAAQRRRRTLDDLMERTPADGMVAGVGTVNAPHFGAEAARCAVLAYDYTVLAGTQGHVNHKKKDRMFELALEWALPVVFFTEGGGGRPGDVDTDDLIMSWLDIPTFTTWPRLSGVAPRIAVNFGRCFAGNAVIFGCADITVATRNSNIGLAGPAMIEGGGLGRFTPEEVGPIEVQTANGVVDLACEDEAEASALTRQLLGYFQGSIEQWQATDQRRLRHLIPENRLRVYDVREVIDALADEGSVIELRRDYGVGLVTAFVRIEGRPFGLIANDPRHLGGAIDGDGGEKGGRFLQLCDAYGMPVVSLCDTPGFMVGPQSEKTAAVRRGSRLILASANLGVPLFCVVLRKAYGLGAQAMAGGGMHEPFFTVAWPTAEFGPMGLEGAVELGFSKELEATGSPAERQVLFDKLVGQMYAKGKGVSVAQTFEIDAVIDPAQTRAWLLRGLAATAGVKRSPRGYVDVW